MDRQSVSSTSLKSVGYDPSARVLEIEFQSGEVYQYSGVPEADYTALMAASSKGSHFLGHLKDCYPHRRVT
jgi:hypothetical protein